MNSLRIHSILDRKYEIKYQLNFYTKNQYGGSITMYWQATCSLNIDVDLVVTLSSYPGQGSSGDEFIE